MNDKAMTDQKDNLCPFSKPIIGKWCRCQHAVLTERCAGKMRCFKADTHMQHCHNLVTELEKNTRFILGVSDSNEPLTHQQYMKIKCGGIQGIHRILNPDSEDLPYVFDTIDIMQERYQSLSNFPFNEIVRDIAQFKHRKRVKK